MGRVGVTFVGSVERRQSPLGDVWELEKIVF